MNPAIRWLCALFCFTPSFATQASIVDFESFNDSDALTTQIPGMTLSGGSILSAGISLNEFEAPPSSGANVLGDNGGVISIFFDQPQESIGAYFTYFTPITIRAYDINSVEFAQVYSQFSSNLALSGDPGSVPNEWMQVTSMGGIWSISIESGTIDPSFVLDDLTTVQAVPLPSSFLLFSSSLALMAGRATRRRKAIRNPN